MIKIPSINDRYLLNGIDVSMLFYAFQAVVANNFSRELSVENNVHHILSMSSILLLQKDHFHPDLLSIFGWDLLNAIVNDMHKKLIFFFM
ncbi:uncharacterized protein BX664DRAFT_206674 [Halteromyces radiatus]|uniref:uncharacterized protein n=1 Tax=Halteromyces radiatus TaxID=101107 RepID=UPI00221EF92F|nr:uncharacterized protein BX664DRAFT_206674 [Halteromyces radiatus]KAI8080002.1 hypothetical protein BX664DRAFT_206674 [Halteromyces radiatus]